MNQWAEYDAEADVLYVTLADGDVEETVELDDLRLIDYGSDGRIVGVEFISPSAGIDLHEVPFANAIERIIGQSGHQFRVVA
ncbi:MAG: DUF2283 domain-containing protein [Dehalococcoidia bacterium]|nr:DUF2283 domain-containing protein [Dehalococcoidia bacterium]MCA9855419.1 DUF2283 domain-containing protein [Dehalococcoidia bacterium]